MTLQQDFDDDFAGSAFGEMSGDKAIIGKWGSIVQLDDGTYDAFFHNVRDLSRPLTAQRLAAIAEKFPEDRELVRLDGEAYAQGQGREFVLQMASLAGVRRKRRMSAEAKARAAETLRSARAAKNPSEGAGRTGRS